MNFQSDPQPSPQNPQRPSAPPADSSQAPLPSLNPQERQTLLDVARRSIEHAVHHGRPLPIRPEDYPPPLRQPWASFVTLHSHGQLRGCIGSLEARRPLVEDVAHNACSAALHDPRFEPVRPSELPDLDIHISILSRPEKIEFTSQEDLLRQLRPGIDGLILELESSPADPFSFARRRATFLPAVWQTLPDPRTFLEHLKLKAGLPADYWSPALRAWRYVVEEIHT